MPRFRVSVTRDASVTFTALVEAKDLTEIEGHMGKHGYQGPILGDWTQDDPQTFDNVEHYAVEDAAGTTIYDEDWN